MLPGTPPHRMSDEVLEEVIRQGIVEQDADTVQFSWHGGEPTLLGLDFFRRVIELEQKYEGGKRVENDLQTNGLLLDDSWCQFLGEHGFLVGLSVDGPKHLHDRFRLTRGGESFFDRTYRAARLLKRHDVAFNTLTVVSSANVRQPDEVYNFLTDDLGCARLQWLPCVEPKDFRTVAPGHWDAAATPVLGTSAARPGNPDSVVTDWSVDPDDWGEFLCRTFDLWLRKDLGRVLVNWFESVVAQRIGQPPENLHASVRMRAVGHRREGRQRLRLRPLHLSAVPAGQYPRASARRFRVFRAAEKVRPRQRQPPRSLLAVPVLFRLLRRVPQESLRQDARRRTRIELPLLGSEALSRPCRAAPARDHRPASFDHNVNDAPSPRDAHRQSQCRSFSLHLVGATLPCHRSRNLSKVTPTCQY